MRIMIVTGALLVGVFAGASLLGGASAETTSTTTASPAAVRTVSVQGTASEPIAQNADSPSANTVYRQGMADAIADGLDKAQFLASKTGATLAAVQNVLEGGGYIECQGSGEYEGSQPDFGYGSGAGVIEASSLPSVAGRSAPAIAKTPSKHKKHHTAKKSAISGCTLFTQVALVYQLG
ncbi:MAG TPA: hypothetical protein VID48_11685 [Solirubrobacteraceae bacterium]|jgi:hypothetical protein